MFAHLDGEALQVALLMPDKIRKRWKDLVDKLSAYYNTPGRLAVVRRQFENACRRPGLDPATFGTELGILALRGFADMKENVCTALMVGGCAEWTILHLTDAWKWTGYPTGKRGMVRVGGSASRTIHDSDAPDPGGGHHPAWRQPKDGTHRPRWTPHGQGFPACIGEPHSG